MTKSENGAVFPNEGKLLFLTSTTLNGISARKLPIE